MIRIFSLLQSVKKAIFKTHLLLFMVFAVTSCSEAEPDQVTRNIRVIAQAEVDGKIVEGSAVMGLRWDVRFDGGVQRSSNTEAVVLGLNKKNTIYILDATIWPDGEYNISYWSGYVGYALGIKRSISKEDFDILRNATGRYPVLSTISNTKTMPVMVSFADEAKRETMFQVTPDNFTKKFGENTKLIGVWFEFTDNPVSDFIKQRLPLMFRNKANKSYIEKYPLRNESGKIVPRDQSAFPQKFGKTAFKQKDF